MQGSPNQLAAAYAAFANGGIYYEPSYVSKIVYSDGTEETFEPNGDRAMKESTAYIITDMLKDVINEGTATPVQIPTVIQAGKTGTSNYADDAWDKVKGDGVPDITLLGIHLNTHLLFGQVMMITSHLFHFILSNLLWIFIEIT